MIIISIGCGLGNQMYEYAFYKSLQESFPNQIIKVDTKYAFPISHNGIEVFELFGINVEEADICDVRRLTKGYLMNGCGFNSNSLLQKIRRKCTNAPSSMKIQTDFTEYDPSFFDNNEHDAYYYGVFANFHYFKKIETKIKELYTFQKVYDQKNMYYLNQINNSNSVSIHVRRGDYLKLGIELTSPVFYINAVRIFEKVLHNPKFFIFSDDINYASSLFSFIENKVIVEGNVGKNCFRDMQLMSNCKHNITANSTFSFWGAFLNQNPNKMVISPKSPLPRLKCPFVCDDWILL